MASGQRFYGPRVDGDRPEACQDTQMAKTSTCQDVSAGSDNSSTVAFHPVLPTGLLAVTISPGSEGTSA